ncbi:MAG TPA: GNAT family N-acetyltransferase [Anaerolineae bacterium]|jgi:RimJ/RimL family protein N-acetyltransferase
MEQQHVHLCVTCKQLITPPDMQPVRWITNDDVEALAEHFQSGREGVMWSPEEWSDLMEQGYLYAGHFRGNRLCSIAGVWKWEPDVWEVINVATKDGYQRMGLAKATVHFVAKYILGEGKVATYTPMSDNIASIRTALGVGFHYCTRLVGNEKWCKTGDRPLNCDGLCSLLAI